MKSKKAHIRISFLRGSKLPCRLFCWQAAALVSLAVWVISVLSEQILQRWPETSTQKKWKRMYVNQLVLYVCVCVCLLEFFRFLMASTFLFHFKAFLFQQGFFIEFKGILENTLDIRLIAENPWQLFKVLSYKSNLPKGYLFRIYNTCYMVKLHNFF